MIVLALHDQPGSISGRPLSPLVAGRGHRLRCTCVVYSSPQLSKGQGLPDLGLLGTLQGLCCVSNPDAEVSDLWCLQSKCGLHKGERGPRPRGQPQADMHTHKMNFKKGRLPRGPLGDQTMLTSVQEMNRDNLYSGQDWTVNLTQNKQKPQ